MGAAKISLAPLRRSSRLIEAGRDGQVAKEIKVASEAKNMGHQFRGTRKTADGHYWVCLMDEKKIAELSPDGTLLRMNEAARALKKVGVKFVWGVAVARD